MRGALAISLLAACGGSSSPGPDAPPPTNTGLVTVTEFHSNGLDAGAASAQFTMGDIFGTKLGSVAECTLTMNPPNQGLSAGTISITGTTTPVMLAPSGTPATYSVSGSLPSQLFTAGATLTVAATGADIPMFTTTVTAPAVVAGFSAPSSISRAAGFHATWTAGATAGKMWLLIDAPIDANNVDVMVCRIPDSGTYMVPPAAFALFPANVTTLQVVLARLGESDVHVGDSEIYVIALDASAPTSQTTLTP